MTAPTIVKTRDEIYPFRGRRSSVGICRIRVFEAVDRPPVVVATEVADNEGPSVTDSAPYLAAEVVARYFPHRFDESEPVVWLEHYDRATGGRLAPRLAGMSSVDQVTFASWTPRVVPDHGRDRVLLGEPFWVPLTHDELARLIGDSAMLDD
ncbi:MAG: hypothetical protein M3Q71_16615 [Chloroflexota bacterium]|nr:hypothetical protein [Chloroflexota bacterium]